MFSSGERIQWYDLYTNTTSRSAIFRNLFGTIPASSQIWPRIVFWKILTFRCILCVGHDWAVSGFWAVSGWGRLHWIFDMYNSDQINVGWFQVKSRTCWDHSEKWVRTIKTAKNKRSSNWVKCILNVSKYGRKWPLSDIWSITYQSKALFTAFSFMLLSLKLQGLFASYLRY